MPRAFDAPSDAGDDYPEFYEDQESPGDPEASAPACDYSPELDEEVLAKTEGARRHESAASPVIDYDLSPLKEQVKDPRRRAVVLREAASRLRTRLYARLEFAAEPILVIYDPLAGLGMWLVKPDLYDGLAGRRIPIWMNPVTGETTVSIE